MEFNDFPNLVQTLNDYRAAFQARLQHELQEDGSNASYNLLKSIDTRLEVNGTQYIVHCSLLDYYRYVDKGTKPHFPPISAIEKWITVKPVQPYPTAKDGKLPTTRQLAYLIARKISEKGTEGTGFFTETQEDMNHAWEGKIREALYRDFRTQVRKWITNLKDDKNKTV